MWYIVNPMETTTKKIAPQVVRERLCKDVNAILSICIQHFDDAHRLEQEDCFDVDAVIAGRSVINESIYARRVTPAVYARSAERNATTPSTLTVPQKGYFIPNLTASRFTFA